MTLIYEYGRVRIYEGKHGEGDYRVEFNGSPPTHAELTMMLGAVLLAEERYTVLGNYLLWSYLDQLPPCKTFEQVRELVDAVQEEKDKPTPLKERWVKVR